MNARKRLFGMETGKKTRVGKSAEIIQYVAIALFFISAFSCQVRVKQLDASQQKPEENRIKVYFDEGFDAAKIIDPNWETKIIPYFEKEAVVITELLANIARDPAGTTGKYARQATKEGTNFNFIVKGTGRVLAVNNESKGSLAIDLPPYDGTADVIILIGPVMLYAVNPVRDAYDGLSFGDFKNQIEWGDVGKAIIEKIKETVLDKLDRSSLAGKTVSFCGAFSIKDPHIKEDIIITPVQLDVK